MASISGRVALAFALLAFASGGSALVATTAVGHTAPSVSTTQTSHSESSETPAQTSGSSTTAFGQSVENYIENTCKPQAAAAGTHGIGECVSTYTTAHNPSTTKGHKGH